MIFNVARKNEIHPVEFFYLKFKSFVTVTYRKAAQVLVT